MNRSDWVRSQCKFAWGPAAKGDKKKELSPEVKKNKNLHQMRMQAEPGNTLAEKRQSMAQKDALNLGLRAKQLGEEAIENLMDPAEYWTYVKEYDRKYYDAVKNMAHEMLKKKIIDKMMNKVKFPAPAPQQGGGMMGGAPGGGMPPPPPMMASNSRAIKTAMYLLRRDGRPHKLFGTLGNEIVRGVLCYPKPDGKLYKLTIEGDVDVMVSLNSPSVKAVSAMEPLVGILTEKASSFLKGNLGDQADEIAKAIMARARRKGKFDLAPLACAMKGPTQAMALAYKVDQVDTPREMAELKKSLGEVMGPYVETLKSALAQEGIKFKESCIEPDLKNPSLGQPSSSPRLVPREEIDMSSDIRSLLMTMMTSDSAPEDKTACAERLVTLICKYPQVYDAEPLSETDLNALSSNPLGAEVSRYAKLATGDDKGIVDEYAAENAKHPEGSLRLALLSDLVSSRDRRSIMRDLPQLAIVGKALNHRYFGKLDPTDPRALEVICEALERRDNGDLDCFDNLVDRKAMQALLASGSMDFARSLLDSVACLKAFGLSWIAEKGTDDDLADAIQSAKKIEKEDAVFPCLAMIRKGDEACRLAHQKLKVAPAEIASMGGKKDAVRYMKANRIDWSGTGIPGSSNIFSSPDCPVALSRNLVSIADTPGMLVLLRRLADEGRDVSDQGIKEAVKILWEGLRSVGEEDKASKMLGRLGLKFDGTELEKPSVLSGEPDPESILFAVESGDITAAAIMLDKMSLSDEQRALDVLRALPEPSDAKTFMDLLPSALKSDPDTLPEWARMNAVLAEALPDGRVILGNGAGYLVVGEREAYACRSSEKVSRVFAPGKSGPASE